MCTELQRADLSYGKLHNTKFVSFNICSKIVGKCSDLTADTGDFATDTSTRRRPPSALMKLSGRCRAQLMEHPKGRSR